MKLNKTHQLDCLDGLTQMKDESIDLMVTSPPYYNARDYSQWDTLEDYFEDMRAILTESYRVLKNHRTFVLNVGDIVAQVGDARWSTRKLPLGAYFTVLMEEIGFEFIDDIIWDKGEPQSKRHLGNPRYPHYQYPVNCYEHILIFRKHRLDKEKVPCPVCNKKISVSNSQSSIGVQSWECNNPNCSQKSKSGRGKRFSARSIMMNDYQKDENKIDEEFIAKWRRDIVPLNPVIKTNSKGDNTLGHTAPFPSEIPEMAIKFYSGKDDIVMDMFMGSGTTGIEAVRNGRRFIGFEIDKEYCQLANARVRESSK